jgi:hypothetical protein
MNAINDLINNSLPKPASDYIPGAKGQAILRDYQHAKKIFIDSNYRLSPKYGFLFYVEFDFNPLISNVSNTAAQELGMIVKTCSLPKFSIDTKIHNAYNRPNIVQNKIKYDPISLTFHDDQADNVRNFWYDYYSFFYRDSDYADVTYRGIHKYQSRPSFDWGYSPRPAPSYNNSQGFQQYQYIQAVRIYSLYQGNFSEYQLVNPVITSFSHGSHAQGSSDFVEHSMSIQFETVKYLTGFVTTNTAGGFCDLHYDNKVSPLTPAQGTDLVDNGMGGVSRRTDAMHDLAYENYLTQASFTQSGLQGGGVEQKFGGFGAAAGTATILSTLSGGFNSGGFSIPNLGSLGSGIPSISMIGQQLKAGAAGAIGGVVGNLANQVVGELGKLVNSAASGILGDIGLGGAAGTNLIGGLAAVISNPAAAAATLVNGAGAFASQQISGAIQNGLGPAVNDLSKNIGSAVSSGASSISSAAGDAYNSIKVGADYLTSAPEGMSYSEFANGYFE